MDVIERFSGRVESYRLHRPRYPLAVVDFLKCECNLQLDSAIVDVAAGTGLLAEIFLMRGYSVTAIEPNRSMRETCAALMARYPALQCIGGAAENTGLSSYSAYLITVGQALHWFDLSRTREEFMRVLQPGGWCAVIYNDRQMDGDAFHEGYEQILRKFGIDYEAVRDRYLPVDRLREFFGVGKMRQHPLPNWQELDLDGLVGRILSSSYMPQPDHPRFAPMCKAIEDLFVMYARGERVRLRYNCVISYGRLG
jgi:SAM-dependent methyltransferase